MDRRLFQEEMLTKSIPGSIMDKINAIDPAIEPGLLDQLCESAEVQQFIASIKVPEIDKYSKTSVLLENVKERTVLRSEKSKKTSKKAPNGKANANG